MGSYGSKQFRTDLAALKNNDVTLRSLSYEEHHIGDDGARALASSLQNNRILRKLSLGSCEISELGLISIVKALSNNRVVPCYLRTLELSTESGGASVKGNPVGDIGAKALAHLLDVSSSLRHLRAAACEIGDEGVVRIAQSLKKNEMLKTLDLGCNFISDIGAEHLGTALSTNITLTGLSLWNNRVFHSGAESLANGLASNCTLKWLGLGCNRIGDEGVKALALALISNAQDSHLVWLALGGNGITDRGAEYLAVALKAQKHTANHGSREGSQANLTEQIRSGKLGPILELGVTPSHVSLAQITEDSDDEGDEQQVQENKRGAGETSVDDSEEYCINLESLGLGGNQITCVGVATFADGLKTNTRLLSLGLADNHIRDDGAAALAQLIRATDTLEVLMLSGNEIGDDGGGILVAALSQNASLKALYLAGNVLGDVVSNRCQEVIGRHNHTLQVLDVHSTRMSTPAVSSLVENMRKEKVLRTLGSQPLPLPGAREVSPLPPTGNMLEMEEWRPQQFHAGPLLKPFTTTAPSQRHTTLEALGSLPAPKETAQTLVVKETVGGTNRRRRSSLPQFIMSKFIRKKSVTDIHSSGDRRRTSRPPVGFELQTLSEEDHVDQETSPQQRLRESAMFFGSAQPGSSLLSESFPSTTSDHAVIEQPSMLPAQTLDSPVYRSSPSPGRMSTVERIGGITNTEPTNEPGDEKPMKDQWRSALKMRVGMVKMGGFLHNGFQALQTASDRKSYDTSIGQLPRNCSKNQPEAPLPPSHSRVKLQLVLEEVGSDYINASFIGSPEHPKRFIISQSPLDTTVQDVWRLVWEHRVGVVIVMTTENEVERWWPQKGHTHSYPLVVSRAWEQDCLTVRLTEERKSNDSSDLVFGTLVLHSKVDQDSDTVQLIHYTGWPHQGIPDDTRPMATVIQQALQTRAKKQMALPVLVVSKLGAGRAGCCCAVSVAFELMSSDNPVLWDNDTNVLDQVIRGVRECRSGLVSTQQQYEFCHQLLLETLITPTTAEEPAEVKKPAKTKWKLFKGKRSKAKLKSKDGEIENREPLSFEDNMNTNLLY